VNENNTAGEQPTAVVSLRGIAAGYGDRVALEGVDVQVAAGDLVAIVGPNGAGKSTLLKVVGGMMRPWAGEVEVLGAPPGRHARRIAYVPQAEQVDWQFPVSVAGVAMMGRYPLLGPGRLPGADDRAAVRSAIERVGMSGHADTQIGELSGGQRRRAFLARAIASDADLFLLDEPVTGVDATTQQDIMDLLAELAKMGRTIVASTHDLACAASCFERVIAVNRTVVADGPASIALDPAVLSRAYGGHILSLDRGPMLVDDPHHHDEHSPGEEHFHGGGA
jgi:ABC-type Mn2+/Zn2+ transport system ATPase subunit